MAVSVGTRADVACGRTPSPLAVPTLPAKQVLLKRTVLEPTRLRSGAGGSQLCVPEPLSGAISTLKSAAPADAAKAISKIGNRPRREHTVRMRVPILLREQPTD